MFKRVDEILDKISEYGVPGYECIICKDGERVYHRINGVADVESAKAIEGGEQYYMYSCSKLLTCTAALMLYERGTFELSDPVSKYLPELAAMKVADGDTLRDAACEMTVEHLFTMTAGFSYVILDSKAINTFKKETEGRCPTGEFAAYISREALLFDPGERFQYSLCHDVLAALVEKISGMKFSAFVKENIFDPLGMIHSTFDPSHPLVKEVITQYIYNAESKCFSVKEGNVYILGTEYESGGAGCISTAADFSLFLEGLRTFKLLKSETIALMTADRVAGRRGTLWIDDYGYGLGVRCPRADRDRTDGVFDYGWGGAAGAYMGIDPVHGITVSYVQHVLSSPGVSEKRTLMRTVAECITGKKLGEQSSASDNVTLA